MEFECNENAGDNCNDHDDLTANLGAEAINECTPTTGFCFVSIDHLYPLVPILSFG